MDIYITEKNTGYSIALPMLPESVSVKSDSEFSKYSIINIGDINVHSGNKPITVSWSAQLPKSTVAHMPFVKRWHWRTPEELESILRNWKSKGTVLNVLVTETNVNFDMMINEFDVILKSAHFWDYSIEFTEYRELKIYTVAEANARKNIGTKRTISNAAYSREKRISYTVKRGDNLWAIAQKYLGKGSLYTKIYAENRDVIGSDPSLIYPGMVITIPNT